MKLMVANRGEIAVRIIRAAAELGIPTVAVFAQDDARSLHTGKADQAVSLRGVGSGAYLDARQIIAVAKQTQCDAIHPGDGRLARNAEFARCCRDSGIVLVGPSIESLELFGNKLRTRAAAASAGVPIIGGSDKAVSLDEAVAFFDQLGDGRGMIIKAVAGSGGRGSRVVANSRDLVASFEKCHSEALAVFGVADLYVEEFWPRARQIEIQILGDATGRITHLGERECSLQINFQKMIDVAPAPGLTPGLRKQITESAVRLAQRVSYTDAGAFKFLVKHPSEGVPFAFIGADPGLTADHTVTEETSGVDIVKTQLRMALGESLSELGLDQEHSACGSAVQARVCMVKVRDDGSIHPTCGTLTAYEAPSGPGIRTDGFGYGGYQTSLLYDTLLAKVIGHCRSTDSRDAIARLSRALDEFRIEGVDTNIPLLQSVLSLNEVATGTAHTRIVDEQLQSLAASCGDRQPRFVRPIGGPSPGASAEDLDTDRPTGPDGSIGLQSPIQGTIVAIDVVAGDQVRRGHTVAVVEAMKLQHDIQADRSGIVCEISMSVGDIVKEGYPIVFINEAEVEGGALDSDADSGLDQTRDDMQEFNDRIAETLDTSHPDAVAARHAAGRRTARENIDDLLDDGSLREFGPATSGSIVGGTVIGFGSVNAEQVGEERARVALIHNDISITTTTNGAGHYEQEPVHELVRDFQVPLVIFSEGEGRPYVGPHGFQRGVGMDGQLFCEFAKLSGHVPLVGVTTGHSFGANATLLSCCDVIIATKNAAIAVGGGPAVVQAAGMGSFTAEEVGSMSFQVPNGNVDVLVDDDQAAVAIAKQYLSYFQGNLDVWDAPDQRRMRHIIPENRVRTYDMREIMNTVADEGSVLELRREFGIGVITAFIRVEGRPLGLVANNPAHLAGAVDSPGADKGARFLQLCDAFDIPVVVFMDCPGIMVGPEHERTALVRHAVRMFNVGGNCSTAMFGVMVRKAYGLGVQAMCGGSAMVPFFNVAWPTAEFAGMNIDGAVKLSARRELMAIEDPEERKAAYDRKVAQGYESARAINSGARYVIDPADTRGWIARGLKSLPNRAPRQGKKRPYVDTW